MVKKQRTILFYIFFILFIIGAPTIVLYSQGYRIDFKEKSISQTGGLYIKATPNSATVTIDGSIEKQTNFLFGTILLENLLSRDYQITVSKKGYHSWQKNLNITKKDVVGVKHIILFPEDITFTKILSEITDLWESPDKEYMIIKDSLNNLISYNKNTGEKTAIAKGNGVVLDDKNERILVQNTIFHIKNSKCENGCTINKEITQAQFSKEKLFFIDATKTLFSIDYLNEISPTRIARNVSSFVVKEDNLFWVDTNGIVFSNNEAVGEDTLSTSSTLYIFDNKLFALSNKTVFELKDNEFKEIHSPVTNIIVSPSETKLALHNESEIWIYYIKDDELKKAQDKVFLTRLSQSINNMSWISNYYLLFSSGNNIKISEIDERDTINIIDIANFNNPKAFLNEKTIYIQSESNLYASDKEIN